MHRFMDELSLAQQNLQTKTNPSTSSFFNHPAPSTPDSAPPDPFLNFTLARINADLYPGTLRTALH